VLQHPIKKTCKRDIAEGQSERISCNFLLLPIRNHTDNFKGHILVNILETIAEGQNERISCKHAMPWRW
jgi:hypothetical protein